MAKVNIASGAIRRENRIKTTTGDKITSALIYIIMTILMLASFYPLYYCLVASFSDAKQILANTLKLAQSGAHIRVRVPTIPNFNDSDKNFIALGEFAKKLGSSLTEIQVLPYHSLGVAKWARIKHKNKVFVADNIPDERVDHLADLLRGMDLPVVIH